MKKRDHRRIDPHANLSRQERENEIIYPAMGAWNEIIGKIVGVEKDSVTLRCTRTVSIRIRPEAAKAWTKVLRRGSTVGVLLVDDGSLRVRTIRDCNG